MANIMAVDFHRRYQKVLWLQEETGEIREIDLKHDSRKEVEEFYGQLGGETTVGLEVSGYSMWFEKLVEQYGHQLKLIHPGEVSRRRVRRQKNDSLDAQLLLQILQQPEVQGVWRGSTEQRTQKMLIRHCIRLKREETRWVNVVRALVYNYNLQIRKGALSQKQKEQIRQVEMTPRLNALRDEMMERIESTSCRVQELKREIAKLGQENESARRLQTIPGIGPMTSLYLVLALGPVKRFQRAKQVVAYVGLDSRESSSDNLYSRRRYGSISKQGDRILRWLLMQCATTSVRHNNSLQRFHRRLSRRKCWQIARTAVARKLLITCYVMLRDQIDYSQFLQRGNRSGVCLNKGMVCK